MIDFMAERDGSLKKEQRLKTARTILCTAALSVLGTLVASEAVREPEPEHAHSYYRPLDDFAEGPATWQEYEAMIGLTHQSTFRETPSLTPSEFIDYQEGGEAGFVIHEVLMNTGEIRMVRVANGNGARVAPLIARWCFNGTMRMDMVALRDIETRLGTDLSVLPGHEDTCRTDAVYNNACLPVEAWANIPQNSSRVC